MPLTPDQKYQFVSFFVAPISHDSGTNSDRKQNRFFMYSCFCFLLFRHRLASGTSEKIQLSSLISAFQVARDLVLEEAS